MIMYQIDQVRGTAIMRVKVVNSGGNKVAIVHAELSKVTTKGDQCLLMANYSNVKSDVQMLDMYSIMSFKNVDGGVWKQGWEVLMRNH